MKLDSRIIEGKKPFDCTDAESEAVKSFIGKKGYFADHISEFKNISDLTESVLKDIAPENLDYDVYDAGCTHWEYFLPAEWVKTEEPEKKYRPYSLNEFSELYAIGDVVTYRIKDCEVIEQSMLIGFQSSDDDDIPGDGYVLIGNCRYSLKELFNNYELNYQNEWQPFGIIDEDKE